MPIVITETDLGTKERAKKAVKRVQKIIPKELGPRLEKWWRKVERTAKKECPVGTPASTGIPNYIGGTLRSSVRRVKTGKGLGKGGVPVKGVGVEFLSEMIVAGGLQFINPNTGKQCDYAVHVHDGTTKMRARPFLRRAIELNEQELKRITDKFLKIVAREFSRD